MTTTTSEHEGLIVTSTGEEASAQPTATPGAPGIATTSLGWFRVGLGLSEIIAPQARPSWAGSQRSPQIARLLGLRQVAAGVGMLTQSNSRGWLWGRVAGDLITMAAMVKHRDPSHKLRSGIAIASLAGITAADVMSARRASRLACPEQPQDRYLRFSTAITVNLPPHEVYQYWHHIENFPKIFRHLKSVRITGEGQSHWIAKGPAGTRISWDAELTEDVANERIAWRSMPGATIPNSGSIRFEPARGGRGTVVRVRMAYDPPLGGYPGIAGIFGQVPVFRLRKDLLRFKQLLEAGEVATTEGQPSGRGSGATWLDRVARI